MQTSDEKPGIPGLPKEERKKKKKKRNKKKEHSASQIIKQINSNSTPIPPSQSKIPTAGKTEKNIAEYFKRGAEQLTPPNEKPQKNQRVDDLKDNLLGEDKGGAKGHKEDKAVIKNLKTTVPKGLK